MNLFFWAIADYMDNIWYDFSKLCQSNGYQVYHVGDFPDSIACHNDLLFYPFKALHIPERQSIPTELYDAVYHEHFSVFHEMLIRNFKVGETNKYALLNIHEARNLFNLSLQWCYYILHTYKIDLIIQVRIPHQGIDYLLSVLGEKIGIKTFYFFQTLFPEKFFILNHYSELGDYHILPVIEENISLPELPTSFAWDYMKNIIPFAPQKRKFNYRLSYFFKTPPPLSYFEIAHEYHCYLDHYFEHNYKNHIKENIDFQVPYVYFPLNLQPEMTTLPLGKQYVDTLLVVERLADLIPDHWLIYVKENPKQGAFQRDSYFYKRLLLNSKVRYLSSSISTFELIKNAEIIATITGTAGWEALCFGKKVLVFGYAWYRKFHGVFEYDQLVSFNDILDFTPDYNQLKEDVRQFLMRCYTGINYPGYESLLPAGTYNRTENIQKVFNAFQDKVKRTFG